MPMRSSSSKATKGSPKRSSRKPSGTPFGKPADRTPRLAMKLAELYPEARISLDFKTPWQCLAATILSAQCTDERVNQVTPALFAKYPDSAAMAAADTRDVERM